MEAEKIHTYDTRTYTKADTKTITRPQKKGLPSAEEVFSPALTQTEITKEAPKLENTPTTESIVEKPTAQVQPSVSRQVPPAAAVKKPSPPSVPIVDKVVEARRPSTQSSSSVTSQKSSKNAGSLQTLIMNESATDSVGSITPDASTPRKEEAKPRTRQQTVVVQSQIAQEIKKAFELAQKSEEPLEDLERKVLAIFAQSEKESASKYEKLRKSASQELTKQKQAFESAKNLQLTHIKELQTVIKNLPLQLQTTNAMTISTIVSSEDARVLRRERDQLETELQSVHETYRNMFTMYEQLKSMNKELREDNDHLREIESRMRDAVKKTNDKYMRMVDHAKERLTQANECIAQLEKKCDDDTVTLRARLRQKELQLDAATKQLEIKKKECSELNEICQALIQKAECVSDSDTN